MKGSSEDENATLLRRTCDDCLDWPTQFERVKNEAALEAALTGHSDCLQAVIASGADVNIKNKDN